MNIHVSKDTYALLKKATIVSVQMGSKMYSLDNEKSDTDILHIIATPKGWADSFVWTHHNLQYKEEGIDHVFCTLQNFVRNILKGDSTINYECLFSHEMENGDLKFISEMRNDFNNFSLIRAYLGLVKRDLKLFSQNYDNKKLFHALRGLWSAKRILIDSYTNQIQAVDVVFYNHLKEIKDLKLTDRMSLIKEMKDTGAEADQLRIDITDKMQRGLMNRIMNEESLRILDQKIKEFCRTTAYLDKVVGDIEINEIYDAINTEVSYS